ncbi:MAG: hypothetical protein KDD62_05985 [Bdellovibrionales bacterium]|nr:hypothetical protein [Bdellovibrionales bacterium]
MDTFAKLGAGFLLAIVLSALLMLVVAIPTMLLWNWVVPEAFGGNAISYPQAWGLLVLAACFIKGADVKIEMKS